MASSIMKKAVALQKQGVVAPNVSLKHPPKIDADEPYRSPVLKGLANVEKWLREEVASTNFRANDATKMVYLKTAASLNVRRPQAGEPPDINAMTNSEKTFFAYRAALRFDACQRATAALRAYEKARKSKDEPAKKAAYRVMLEAAADLVMYPKDAAPGLPNLGLVRIGAADEKQKSAFKKDDAKAVKNRSTKKLKAANQIQKIEGWGSLIFNRLIHLESPWATLSAIGALTGARPEEMQGIVIERKDGFLVFTIQGAKVSNTAGQPWRKITVKSETMEFKHLWDLAEKPYTVQVPPVADYPDAYSAALARAGASVFPAGTPRMSAYVYRHAIASDAKAEGFSREQISALLGHAVSKTADYYGRAIGGKTGVRQLSVEVSREVKMNHNTAYERFATPGFDI